MSNIVSIVDGKALTTSMAIAEGVGNPHKTVIQLIRQNTEDLGEFGNLAFEMRNSKGAGRKTEYALLNEQQATLLMTYMRNNDVVRAFKKRLVKAFYEMQRPSIPQSLPDALRLAAELAEERDKLRVTADAYDRIAVSDGGVCITNAAKDLQMSPKALFQWLHGHKWIYKRTGGKSWIAYQDKLRKGVLEHKVTTLTLPQGGGRSVEQVLVTPKGLTELARACG